MTGNAEGKAKAFSFDSPPPLLRKRLELKLFECEFRANGRDCLSRRRVSSRGTIMRVNHWIPAFARMTSQEQ